MEKAIAPHPPGYATADNNDMQNDSKVLIVQTVYNAVLP